ncbi:MAG: hypothetical protein J5I90_09040 [Caldilineales bacterium]|nr:hypothetical protein [Caldilineales bacterium]
MLPILWQDETAIAVDKPSGLLVHNSRYAGPKEVSLRQMLGAQVGQPVYPVHRLDRPTSGIVLFVKEREQAAAWQEALGGADKRYLALVRGHVKEAVVIDHAISEDGGSKEARSRVQPLMSSPIERCSLVEIRLETGRKHQARRHLAHISHPVVGDTTHGKGDINRHYRSRYDLYRLALHAWRLHITPPSGNASISITAPIPFDLKMALSALFPAADWTIFD